MLVTYCDFCGEKILTDAGAGVFTVTFSLPMVFGGRGRTTLFHGCDNCVEEVYELISKFSEKSKRMK